LAYNIIAATVLFVYIYIFNENYYQIMKYYFDLFNSSHIKHIFFINIIFKMLQTLYTYIYIYINNRSVDATNNIFHN